MDWDDGKGLDHWLVGTLAVRGDSEAWQELDRRTRPRLTALARRLLAGVGCVEPTEADDIVQKVWITKTSGPMDVLVAYQPGRHGSLLRFLRQRVREAVRQRVRQMVRREGPEADWARQHAETAGTSESQEMAEMLRALPADLTPGEAELARRVLEGREDAASLKSEAKRRTLQRMKAKIEAVVHRPVEYRH
jgi:DNA-directed RNA polymerase specialized sigma24 family protein